jgi:hypothetical protein
MFLYGLAFAFQATSSKYHSSPPTPIDFENLSASNAYKLTWYFRDKYWLANPALWFGTILLMWRLWPYATGMALLGLGLAGEPAKDVIGDFLLGFSTHDVNYEVGYWLWLASVSLLFMGSLLGWCYVVPRDRRCSPKEVFRGLRGMALGSWLAVGVSVFVAWWFKSGLPPPFFGDWGIGVFWMVLGLGLLIMDKCASESSKSHLWRVAMCTSWLLYGLIAVLVCSNWSEICPPPRPK